MPSNDLARAIGLDRQDDKDMIVPGQFLSSLRLVAIVIGAGCHHTVFQLDKP
jgi:hypothetical protein